MKKMFSLVLALMVSFGMVACGIGSASAASQSTPITIRLSGAFAEGSEHYYYFETFCKSVNERSGGSVTVVWGHGPEAIPSDQLAEAMQNGIVELVYTPIAYVVTVVPGLAGLKLTDPATMRKNGGFEYVDSLTMQKLNVHYLARTQDGSYFVLGMNMPISGIADLKGKTIRGTSATKPIIQSVGAEMVAMGWADVYQGLEKNVVQGAGGSLKDFVDNDLGAILKTVILPGAFNSDSSLLLANHIWDKLDEAQRSALIQSALDWEIDSLKHNTSGNEENITILETAGVKVVDLGKAYIEPANEAAWAEVQAADAAVAAELRKFAGN
ncbi:MAG: TRAP transporter substrate-binding protein DctP [Synergistaceae bacterium]|jgi:TRAP-type C4-dicarboxylate transport system substrate-binding protein|nr:TRAP transporter substrate-binding protein DctP [Synergistaceae bacterium]